MKIIWEGIEYNVLTDEEADNLAKECILDSIWAFNASFISSHSDVSEAAIKAVQEDRCEYCNEDLKSIIKDLDHFVDDAISCDGRGHFINQYDGEEIEIEIDGEDYYAYKE
jgi:hypothetical protein